MNSKVFKTRKKAEEKKAKIATKKKPQNYCDA